MSHYTSQDIKMAKRFLSHLSQDEESIFAFQIFNDRKTSESSVMPQVLCGILDEFVDQFIRLQEQGAGIFVTINQTDGKGRKIERMAKDLTSDFPGVSGFSVRNLKYMRKFAEVYPDSQFVQACLHNCLGGITSSY